MGASKRVASGREPEPLRQLNRTYVRLRGRKYSYFSGCDYLRLSSHPRVMAALTRAVAQHGLTVAASRLTTGNHKLYQQLEKALARFFDAPTALLAPTGYISNLVVAEALAGNFSHAVIDARSHPSLWAATQLLNCPVLSFRHRDPEDLAKSLRRCGAGARPIVLTDGLFAHDGSTAPLGAYVALLPPEALILVDDAHGAGILGAQGRGTLEHCGVSRRRIVQTVTLSKAFGAYGGAVLGSRKLRRLILSRSHMFIGSTPIPLPVAAAALASLAVLRTNGGTFTKRLTANTAWVRDRLRRAGLQLPDHPGPMVTLVPKNARQSDTLRRSLLKAGVFPPLIHYPGGPPGGYFRFVISSEHTPAQLENLARALVVALCPPNSRGV